MSRRKVPRMKSYCTLVTVLYPLQLSKLIMLGKYNNFTDISSPSVVMNTIHASWTVIHGFYRDFKGPGLMSAPVSNLIMVRANYGCFFDSPLHCGIVWWIYCHAIVLIIVILSDRSHQGWLWWDFVALLETLQKYSKLLGVITTPFEGNTRHKAPSVTLGWLLASQKRSINYDRSLDWYWKTK